MYIYVHMHMYMRAQSKGTNAGLVDVCGAFDPGFPGGLCGSIARKSRARGTKCWCAVSQLAARHASPIAAAPSDGAWNAAGAEAEAEARYQALHQASWPQQVRRLRNVDDQNRKCSGAKGVRKSNGQKYNACKSGRR